MKFEVKDSGDREEHMSSLVKNPEGLRPTDT